MSGIPGDSLRYLCSGAQQLIIAAPYVKAGALARILAVIDSMAVLVCITRWNLHDLVLGASDIECRTMVIERGGTFMLHPSLHAKYYQIDDVTLIGSANLTPSAMGWSQQPNLEILCRAGDDFDALSFQQVLFRDARELTDAEFTRWKTMIAITSQNDRMRTHIEPQLDTWRPTTRDPIHLELAYRGRQDEIASTDEQQAAQRDIQAIAIPQGLTDDQARAWMSSCLFAAPFTDTVIRLQNTEDRPTAVRLLAETYGLSVTSARRNMETVQNWLAFFAPATLHKID